MNAESAGLGQIINQNLQLDGVCGLAGERMPAAGASFPYIG